MTWNTLVDPASCERLCLTLLHSVWQAPLLALVAWRLDRLWRKRAVERRYAVSVAALLVSLAAMPITYVLIGGVERPSDAAVETSTLATAAVVEPEPTAITPLPVRTQTIDPPLDVEVPTTASVAVASSPVVDSSVSPSRWRLLAAPWIVALYTAGVALMLARLALACIRANRLGAHADFVTEGPLFESLRSLARKWSMRVVPALARAERIVVPKVVGLARPTILLPAAAISGLSMDELEMILAHELAHVRRYDMWVNLVQRLAEAVLFFNPALWYLSRRISTLREYCCDEITCGAQPPSASEPRVRYATALLRVVELAKPNAAAASDLASLAANGRSPSELRRRVARLFGEPLREPVRLSRGGLVTLALLAAVLLTAPTAWRSATNFAASPGEDTSKDKEAPGAEEDGFHSIGGVLLDEAGAAVADADVWLSMCCKSHPVGERVQHGKSDSRGRFALEIPSDWFANRDPHSPITLWTYAAGHQLGIEQGNILTAAPFEDDASNLEIRLKVAADTSFVILDTDERPVADAVVAPYRMTYQPTPEAVLRRIETRTDTSGRANLPAVGRDELDAIRVTAKGFGIQMQRYMSPEYPLPAENTIRLRPVGRIEGRILAENPEWARGVRMILETERMINGNPTRGFAQVESDDEGRFTVPGIANGRLNVRFLYLDEKLPVRPRLPQSVTVQTNTTTELEIPMIRLVPVRGSVTVKDADTPVSGLKIGVHDGSGRRAADSVSDSQGRFTAQVLPGSVRLQVYDQSKKYVQLAYVSHEVPDQTEEFTLPPLEVVRTKTIAGRLVDERDQPVANAVVIIQVENRGYISGKSDVNGQFEVVGAPAPIDEATADYEVWPDGVPRYETAPDGTVSRRRLQTTVMKTDPLTIRVGMAPEVDQDEPTAAPEDASHEFCLWVDGPDGASVPNARVDIRSDPVPTAEQIVDGQFLGAHLYGAHVMTDNLGRLTVKFPSRPKRLELNIKQPGFGPYWAAWYEQKAPQEFTAELDAAWSVGGVVVDDAGQPVEGVEVSPSLHYKKRPGDTRQLGVGSHIVTDAEGKWQCDHVPVSKSDVHVAFDHADYSPLRIRLSRDAFEVKQDESPSAQTELTPGLTVTGTVVDESGEPISGALVRTKFLNDIREAITNAQGQYRLTGCEPRTTRIVISAPGRAIDMQEVQVDPDMKPVDFAMRPGGKIRVRVVDEQGVGIPKARIFFQRWRGRFKYFEFDHVSQYTDENGVWQWDEAPLDEFKADICRPGGMQLSKQSLIAREEEYVFTPPRALVISGTVVDAKTKEPIEKFRVVPGTRDEAMQNPGESWQLTESREATGGTYRIVHRRSAPAHLVRIEAEGYRVAVLRDFMTDEGAVTCDVELEPAEDVAATILTPSGQPAANAEIALGVRGSQIIVKNGAFRDISTFATRLDADADGRFNIPSRDDPFQLVILHSAGFAHVKSEDGPIPNPIKLTAWARAEGTFRVGQQPGANVVLSMFSQGIRSWGADSPNISTRHEVRTDAEGRFVFERVVPGAGRIGRDITLMVDDGATEVTSSQRVPVELVAGETTVLNLGGTGRAVVGKLAPPADYSERVLWNFALISVQAEFPVPPMPTPPPKDVQDDPEKSKVWWETWIETEEGKRWNVANNARNELQATTPSFRVTVDRDGSFRIDDMPQGPYVLSVRFHKHSPGFLSSYRFSTPPLEDGRAAEPFDLGTLTLETQ